MNKETEIKREIEVTQLGRDSTDGVTPKGHGLKEGQPHLIRTIT